MIRWLPLAGTVAILGFCVVRADQPDVSKLPPARKAPVDFVRDVKPLLETHCARCHATEKPKGKFSLKTRTDALKSGESGPNLIAGDSARSKLIHYVGGLVEDTPMPPKGQGQPLSRDEVALLRAWIDQGASWPTDVVLHHEDRQAKHWAFVPPVRPALPAVQLKSWPHNAIDYFILARQESAGLKPSPEADRTTLIRRLYLDLIGLPPTPREVDEFLADTSPKAYDKVVERLLASPHYGERWGRHWLDAARYADSDGYEKDMSRQIYFYRDWVVKAFNRDLPYDRFIIEQLAGDLLPNPSQDQRVATGFLRNSMLNEEGGIDPEQFRMDAMFDRMDAIGKSVLGLTIQCCQCHSHKYDPMTQEEYYRLFAYLNNDHEAFPVVYTEQEQKKIAELTGRMRLIEDGLKQRMPDWQRRLAAWETQVKANQPKWTVLPVRHVGEHDQHYFYLKDDSVLAQGYAPTKFGDRFQATTDLKEIRAFRLELLTDPNLPFGGPGRSFMGTCALTEFRVEAADAKTPDKKTKVKLIKASADYANPERPLEPNFDDRSKKKRVTGPVQFAIDDKDDTAWGIDAGPGRRNQDRKAVFNVADNVARPNGTVLTFQLVQNHGGWNSDDHMNNNLGRFRISVTDRADAVADPLPRKVRDTLAIPAEKRTPAQQAAVFSYWRRTVPEWQEANAWIEELWKEWPKGDMTLALVQRQEPRETHMLKRGDWLKPAKKVTAGVPAFLHPLADPNAPANRLTLAKWLVDRRAPTTARVFVNRMWQHYFGTGLVSTPEDFGLQSEKPSHPELLDWLAVEFMDSGWSIKHMHRLIVHSATYRQSSHVTPELLEKDPLNRLIARAPRLRVEGEIVRDIALSASGLLNPKIGGPSIFSPAPAFLFMPPASYGPFNWIQATGTDRYRRALYTFRRRSTPYPILLTFDTPNGDFSCVRRNRSNTPLQALTTLNESVFMDAARALAARVLREGGKSDDDRLTYAFRLCVSRPPSADEKAELAKLLEKERTRVASGSLNAKELATGQKDGAIPDGLNADQLAAYTIVSRVLLNLDETITKE
jgi:mono/diheme cytochrome c family protein